MFPRTTPHRSITPPLPLSCRLASVSLLALLAATAAAPASADDASTVPTVTVEGERSVVAPIGQSSDAEGIKDYRVTRTTTGAKGEIANQDLPQAIVTVPLRLLEEQNAATLNDVFRNVAGVQPTQSATSGSQWPVIRGFAVRNVYKDGLRDDTFDRTYWLGNVERVDILKGPASVLFGDGNPGGSLNFITKKPLPDNTYSATVWGGSYNTVGGLADVSLKATEDGRTLVRAIADRSASDTFVNGNKTDAGHASLLGQRQLNDHTSATVGFEYRQRTTGAESGLPVWGSLLGRDLALSRASNYNSDWSARTDTGTNLSGKLSHEFAPGWSVNLGLLLNHYNFHYDDLTSITGYNANRSALTRRAVRADSDTDELVSDSNITGEVRLFNVDQRVTVGTELSYGEVTRQQSNGTIANISILSPTYSARPTSYALSSDLTLDTWRRAVYGQDLIDLTHGLKLLVGVRHDLIERESDERGPTKARYQSNDSATSARAGLTWEALDGVTFYGGFSQSFVPPGNTASLGASGGQILPVESGEQYEAGVKLDLGQRFTATAAVYQLTRSNVPTADPNNALVNIAAGEQRSRGFELDASWQVLEGWNLLASYAYTNAKTTKDSKIPLGNRLDNVPEHSARLWSVYEVPAGPLAGLGFGGGVSYVGDRQGDLYNTYTLPAYATVDLTAYYSYHGAKLSLNATNVLDQRYYLASNSLTATSGAMVYMGEPATVIARLQVSY